MIHHRRVLTGLFVFMLIAGCLSAASAQQTPLTFTEPYLLTLSPDDEMNVCWLTSEPVAEAYVEYGLTPSCGERVQARQYEIFGLKRSARPDGYDAIPANNPALPVYQQIGRIDSLKTDRLYYYRTVTRGASGREVIGKGYYFKTGPSRGKHATFALLSDLQQKPLILSTVKMIGQAHPDFIIYNGDMQNTPWKAGEWFAVPGTFIADAETGKEWFTAMQQTADGATLLQYVPIFPCPGNHEVTDQRVLNDKVLALDMTQWNLSIYMQLFRPLYPEQQYGFGGKHWYSVDYGDLHISSLSAFRWQAWGGYEFPGWRLFDDLRPESAQYAWLMEDLSKASAKYKWVSMHWHMLNRGTDVQFPYSQPAADAITQTVTYPEQDYCFYILKPLFEQYGVNGVSFGHSHVYERYLVNGVNYIEAASIGNNYRISNGDTPHPSGLLPTFEENRFRSFMLLTFGPSQSLVGRGIQASPGDDGPVGFVGRTFDTFDLVVKPTKNRQ